MKLEAVIVSLATTLGSLSAAGAEPQPLGRDDFAALVLQIGPATRVLEARTASARATRDAAGRSENPAFSWERSAAVSGRRADESQDDLLLRAPLVVSGRLAGEQAAAAAGFKAVEQSALWARARLIWKARRAFDAVLAARGKALILDRTATRAGELLRIVVAREKAGESAGYERLRMELEGALVADLRSAIDIERAQAESAAAALLGREVSGLPPFAGDLLSDAARPIPETTAVEQRADLQALALEIEAAEGAARAARRRAIPDPAVTAGVQVLDLAQNGRGIGYIIGLEVPLPLLDSGSREADVAMAGARATEAERMSELSAAARDQLSARVTLLARRERLSTHRIEVLARAEGLREIAAAAWRAGGAEFWTLLDAERVAREARLMVLELALDASHAEADLRFLSGDMGAEK